MNIERTMSLNRGALTAVLLVAAVFSNRSALAQEPESAPTTQPTTQPTESHHGQHGGSHGMPHSFENAEHWTGVFDDPARGAWQQPQEVVRVMALEPGMTVADIGAGTGYFLPHLSQAVGAEGTVLALDIEASLVEHLQERATQEELTNVSARVVAPDDPALDPGSVDRVLIVNTWHHIGDRTSYAAKLAEGLSPGGAVFIVDFTRESSHGPPVEHRLSPEQVAQELEAGGLTTETAEESLPDQYIVVGWRRE